MIEAKNPLRDCGQDGVCVYSPGCVEHMLERNRELLAERDAALAHANQLQTDIENEQAGRLSFRRQYGALDNETMGMFLNRLASERDSARDESARISSHVLALTRVVVAARELCSCNWLIELHPCETSESVMEDFQALCDYARGLRQERGGRVTDKKEQARKLREAAEVLRDSSTITLDLSQALCFIERTAKELLDAIDIGEFRGE